MKSMTIKQYKEWKWYRLLNSINPFYTAGLHPAVEAPTRHIRIKSLHEIDDAKTIPSLEEQDTRSSASRST